MVFHLANQSRVVVNPAIYEVSLKHPFTNVGLFSAINSADLKNRYKVDVFFQNVVSIWVVP